MFITGASRTASPARPASITGKPSQPSQQKSSSGPMGVRRPQQPQMNQGFTQQSRQVQPPKPQPRAASPQRTLQSTGGTTGTGYVLLSL